MQFFFSLIQNLSFHAANYRGNCILHRYEVSRSQTSNLVPTRLTTTMHILESRNVIRRYYPGFTIVRLTKSLRRFVIKNKLQKRSRARASPIKIPRFIRAGYVFNNPAIRVFSFSACLSKSHNEGLKLIAPEKNAPVYGNLYEKKKGEVKKGYVDVISQRFTLATLTTVARTGFSSVAMRTMKKRHVAYVIRFIAGFIFEKFPPRKIRSLLIFSRAWWVH